MTLHFGRFRIRITATMTLSLLAALVATPSLNAAMRLPLLNEDGLSVEFASEDDTLAYGKAIVGTLEVTTRPQDTVRLPDLRERLRGFETFESFEAGSRPDGKKTLTRWRLRMIPAPEGPWTLMPFVVTLKDTRTGTEREVLTQAIDFPAPPPLPSVTGEAECDLEPEWVAPGWITVGKWALWSLPAILVLLALFPLTKRLRRTLRERTLSPRERARLEMNRLLARNLIAQGKFKPFYYELTGVVRRFFERSYSLRATRQTSEEFIAVLMRDIRFSAEERTALSDFLASADRIKFSGREASSAEAEAGIQSAENLMDRTMRPEAPAPSSEQRERP